MRLLFLTKHLMIGGAERSLINLLKILLATRKYEIDLKLIYNNVQISDPILSKINISYIFEDNNSANKDILKKFNKNIYKHYIPEEYDYEIAFLEGFPTKIIACSDNVKSKKIAWVHVNLNEFHYTKNYYTDLNDEMQTYMIFDNIIFVSKAAMNGFQTLFKNYDNVHKLKVVYNLIDFSKIDNSLKGVKYHDIFDFCNMSRLATEKRLHLIVYASYILKLKGYSFKVAIVGSGKKYRYLREVIRILGLSEYVILFGFRQNPYPILSNSNTYISTSDSEGIGLSLVESIYLNKFIIATPSKGVLEALENTKNFKIVDDNNIIFDLSKIMEECLLNKQPPSIQNNIVELIQLFYENPRKSVLELFSLPNSNI